MQTRRTILALAIAGLAGASSRSNADSAPFVLTIARKYSSDTCTSGYLAVNSEIICYTLERPWQDNKTDLSSIPVGQYPATVRYDHPDKWRIELDVPGRPHVQIHTGNSPGDSKGCIIVGMQLTDDLCSIVGGTSKQAYEKLRVAFYGSANPVATPDKNIQVRVEE